MAIKIPTDPNSENNKEVTDLPSQGDVETPLYEEEREDNDLFTDEEPAEADQSLSSSLPSDDYTANFSTPGSDAPHFAGNNALQLDPAKIKVEIPDKDTPIVVLFGPPASGKTMMLIRLTRWLKKKGYGVMPIRTFRPADDAYESMCDSFNAMVDSNEAAENTKGLDFMLLKVSKDGHPICQILEAPGEHYYDPRNPEKKFPPYLHKIITEQRNRKIYTLLMETEWKGNKNIKDDMQRTNYVEKIRQLKTLSSTRDRFIVILNKIDLTDFRLAKGRYNRVDARREVSDKYPDIFKIFLNEHPITRFFRPSFASFGAFQSGEFSQTADGNKTIYTAGADDYARELWGLITNACK